MATRVEIAKFFTEFSGRYDLVTDAVGSDYTDSEPIGAGFFINSAVRNLENLVERRKEFTWERHDVAAGESFYTLENVKSLKEVWFANSEGRTFLEKVSEGWIRETYPKQTSEVSSGKPCFWAPVSTGFSQNQLDLTAVGGANPYTGDFTYDTDDLVFGDHYGKVGILWRPPLDGIYTLSVLAQFYEKPLVEPTDTNFWSTQFPDILVTAALRELEKFYRNSAGVQDFDNQLVRDLRGVGFEVYEQEISGANQLRG